jgi:hypothetical protein
MLAGIDDLVGRAVASIDAVRRFVAFWGPVAPYPVVIGPFLALASIVSLAVLMGIAVGALATLLVVLVALYLLLTEVFGFSLELQGN